MKNSIDIETVKMIRQDISNQIIKTKTTHTFIKNNPPYNRLELLELVNKFWKYYEINALINFRVFISNHY